MRVPDEAGAGKAKVTLSFADWKGGKVSPATFEVAIVDPDHKAETKPAQKADLNTIPRTIAKEPAYKNKPKYCLLVFGPEAKNRRWLVWDRDVLYVDRNGTGDLTESGNSTPIAKKDQDPAPFEPIDLLIDGKKHRLRFTASGWFNLLNEIDLPVYGFVEVSWLNGQTYEAWGDHNGNLAFGPTAAEAPIVQIGGPLQMGFETPRCLEKKKDKEYELKTGIGTPGLGNGTFAHLKYDVVPKGVHPEAILEFPGRSGKPVKVRVALNQRC